MNCKITHLTSAHPRYDTRIFVKMCRSLAKIEKYHVSLIVADGKGDETIENIDIYDVGSAKGRLSRIFITTGEIFKKALYIKSDIYHIHDPELIPVGLKLKKMGKRVIFDSHEDLPKQLLSKPYLNTFVKKTLSLIVSKFEISVCKKFDYIITATPHINDKFVKYTSSIDINNFPIVEELVNDIHWDEKKEQICYVGVISKIRGNMESVKAMKYVDQKISFKLAGIFYENEFFDELKQNENWQRVDFVGKLNRKGIKELLGESKAGIVTLHPTVNYLEALPVKMFEYMLAGIPVIASDFKILRDIVNKDKCGICVDPLDPGKIAEAINYIFANPKEAYRMGQNGKRAVLKRYNWSVEEQKLYNVYEKVLND